MKLVQFPPLFVSLLAMGCGSLAEVQVSDSGVSSNGSGSGGDNSSSGSGGSGDFGGSNSAGSDIGSGGSGMSTTGAGGSADPTGSGGSGMMTGSDAGGTKPDAGGPAVDSGGTPGKLTPAQTNLDGQKYLLACGPDQGYSNLVCQNPQGACPNQGQPYLTLGMHNRDEHVKFGGTAGTVYQVTIHVRGIVEPKHYTGGVKDTAHEGFYTGGAPSQSGNYNVYLLKISGQQGQSYFLNALNQQEAHFSYPIDYTVTIPIEGGADMWFLSDDSNCSAIKNCDTSSVDKPGGQPGCKPITLTGFNEPGITQPYNGQFIVIHVTDVK
jgi:hypothetical protein